VALNDSYTGFALTNTGSFTAQVVFRLYDNNGNLSLGEGITNPVSISLNPGEQIPVLTTQLFAVPSSTTPGWVEVESPSPAVRAFFLYGAGPSLDGADAGTTPLTDFVFQRIQDAGETIFTSLSIVNPNLADANATLELRDANGTLLGTATATIGARKRVVKVVRDLFPNAPASLRGGTIRVRSDQGLVGFELFSSDADDLGGINPQRTTDTASTLYFAQLVSRGGWFTEISLTNPNAFPIDVELKALRDSGDIIPGPRNPLTVRIPAGGQYNATAEATFQFAGTGLVSGYVSARVTSGSGGMFGHVSFGTTDRRALAALPVQTTGSRAMVFSQIAQDDYYFTGITLLNTDATASANVKIEAFDEEGRSLGPLNEVLRPGEKKARVLTQIIPGSGDRLAGYVVVTSDRPLIGFELFGDLGVTFLAAVPAQPYGSASAAPASSGLTRVAARAPSRAGLHVIPSAESPVAKLHRALGRSGATAPGRPEVLR
jgi:hypothetical protein